MKLTHTISAAGRYAHIRYHEEPSVREWSDAIERTLRDPQFEPGFTILLDRRGIPDAPTAAFIGGAALAAETFRRIMPSLRWCFLVHDTASLGMAQMTQAFAPDSDSAVFTDFADALAWAAGTRSRRERFAAAPAPQPDLPSAQQYRPAARSG